MERSSARPGRNKTGYFILPPGDQLTLEDGDGASGKGSRLVITVLDETKNVGGVETRVVEERETSGGVLVAMDRAEIVDLAKRVASRAGVYDGCLKTKETSPLEPFAKEYKVYAPGVGLVKDGALELVSHGSLMQ